MAQRQKRMQLTGASSHCHAAISALCALKLPCFSELTYSVYAQCM